MKFQFTVLLLSLLFIAACNKDEALPDTPDDKPVIKNYQIELIESYLLDIAEPSGLSWALNQTDLIIADDHTNKAFIIDNKGNTLSEFPYEGDDTEGITIDKQNNEIWIAEEAKSEIIQLNAEGNELNSYKIDINRTSKKKGLEGLSYDYNSKTFYILNEAEPGLLIKWQINNGIISQKQLNFAQDYSGIFFDNVDQNIWIVSDKTQKLFYCDKDANMIQDFDLDYQKAEGIVVDIANERVYIVSDSEHKLYIYKITKI
jgi:uncharacterized protein YjiK